LRVFSSERGSLRAFWNSSLFREPTPRLSKCAKRTSTSCALSSL
jgi:hypothetical protein